MRVFHAASSTEVPSASRAVRRVAPMPAVVAFGTLWSPPGKDRSAASRAKYRRRARRSQRLGLTRASGAGGAHLFELVRGDQDLARLRPEGRTADAGVIEQVHETAGAGEAHLPRWVQ